MTDPSRSFLRDTRPAQGLRGAGRHDDRARGRRSRHRARQLRVHRRPLRMRQVDPAADHGRPRRARRRARCSSKTGKVEAPPPTVIYVFQQYTRSLFPWKTVERNVAFGLESRESLSRQAIAARTRELIGLVKLYGLRTALSLATLGRHAAARGDRARSRLPPRCAADGRAVQRGRRAHACRPAGTRARAVAGARPHRRLRHP